MKRLLSYLVLLMLFATGSYASVPLTSVTYSGNCETHLNEAISNGGTIYGDGSVPASAYADLSDYSTLTLTGTNVGNARLLFNRLIDNGAVLEVVPNNSQYATVSNNVATIDLQAIRNANNQMVRLMVIKSYWGQTVTINSWELEPKVDNRQAVEWNIDNGITIDDKNVKDKFNYDNPINIPVRNSDLSTWTISPRFKVRLEGTGDEGMIDVKDLCNGSSFDASYFEVIYSNNGILSHQSIDYNGTPARPRIRNLTANKRGVVSMTFVYKGNANYKPFSKTYFFNIEGIPTHFDEWDINNPWNKYEKYLDDGEFREIYGLYNSNGNRITMTTLPTVTAVDDLGEPITSKVVNFYGNNPVRSYSNQQGVDIHLIPNTLGTVTYKVEYPGDDIYGPATYMFDVNIKQHMVDLKWVKTQWNSNSNSNVVIEPYEETDEWLTNQENGYKGQPALKKFKDNVEDNSLSVTYTSSNPNVATIDASSGNLTWRGGGVTVITATVNPQKKVVDGITYYYYNQESVSYTLKLWNYNAGDEPRIVWISAAREFLPNYTSLNGQARGSYVGQQFVNSIPRPYDGSAIPLDYSAGYGNKVDVSAIALKSTVTDAELEQYGIKHIPGAPADHYYVLANGGWRAYKEECIPSTFLFDSSDPYQKKVKYIVDKPGAVRETILFEGAGGNFDENNMKAPTSTFRIIPAYPSYEPIKIIAYIDGKNQYSTTDVLVEPGNLQLHFVPDENTVNEGQSILPYVNCPDLRMEDVKKIWLTYECDEILDVHNNGVVYETGKTSQTDIAKYLYTVTSNDIIWKDVNDANNYNADGTPNEEKILERRAVTWLRGINPEIFGKSGAASLPDPSCTVTLHLTSEMYQEATADYKLTVVGDNTKPMFYFEMYDKKNANGESQREEDQTGEIKTITIAKGDFIYMPGICGNSNGNLDYSMENENKYLYAIKNGTLTMSYAKYFPGEGVPNYYLTTELGGQPSIPQSGATADQSKPAIITWSHGLGNYWRNDSLMIYANKVGEMYLYAQDPQTHVTCRPIKINVIDNATLKQAKQRELGNMTYPFTWDFEHMDLTKYIDDAQNNGGTYWAKEYDEPASEKRPNVGHTHYNRDYAVENHFYQYNGGMNADWDDKDYNGTSRQRWFKDIYSSDGNGSIEYAPEFKGIMINLSGLDYWEQKFQRFAISSKEDDKFIVFRGGPIFLQLPGFGLLDKKTGVENLGTREYDNYIGGNDKTKGWHNHINTAGFNVNEGYTQMLSVDNKKNKDVTYPVQEKYRNNKVRFVIKARGGRQLMSEHLNDMIPNENPNSQFHIGGASMLNENLNVNDIRWSYDISDPTVHNGYSVLNLDDKEAKVYIVELDPYDPELQDHIYLMFNNDVYVYWMAITNEPRNILSDFDGVTYSYPKDIDMDKTNQTLAQQTTEGIYTKASDAHDGTYALASVGQYTKKGVYKVPGAGENGVQLQAYTVNSFDPSKQAVTLTPITGNIPKNEGVMLYSTPRMSALASTPEGLEAAVYNRGTTAYSVPHQVQVWSEEKQKYVWETQYTWHTATSGYNNVHNYYYLPLYFIAQAENMSAANYHAPESTYGGLDISQGPTIADGHVTTPNLLRPTTYGQVLAMHERPEDQPADVIGENDVIHFGYNNEFICRNLVYVDGTVTKVMDPPYVTRPDGAYEDIYYYEIGIDYARFYRINTSGLNHHNRSAYMTLTWNEYTVHTEGKPLSIVTSGNNQAPANIRFSSRHNPIDLLFADSDNPEELVSEGPGLPDGINEVEQAADNDGKVYNLNGTRVNTLRKGIYIFNGKKVVVK